MDDISIARVIHVLAILLWIGGVAFVTLVVMPSIGRAAPGDSRMSFFRQLEGRFAFQARLWVLLAGMSGLWMVHRGHMWVRFADPRFWWMHAMLLTWLIFAAMLFVIEPMFVHRHTDRSVHSEAHFRVMGRMHRALLALSLVTLLGAVGGSHGLI
ncbi:hypothetical protein [Sphingobium vermicomposti]|uniref:Putative membrane protein n=1 Tax=Sphingobium vermicomposti TaxID=529005 RepID=A0A846M426_9SPHN|nr:putative membrane protein [Sphingobium vermicomposti]